MRMNTTAIGGFVTRKKDIFDLLTEIFSVEQSFVEEDILPSDCVKYNRRKKIPQQIKPRAYRAGFLNGYPQLCPLVFL